MAEALYRKYRPQVFEDVVGQGHIERTLKNAIDQDKVSHAYLFCGPRGTGKTTMARLLAKALLCEHGPTSCPDGTCQNCIDVAEGQHPDVYELDAASRTGVENVREEIIGRVNFAPTRGNKKVYIVDEVHMLSTAAFNALLKTLEEPPSHVIFVLCTTDPQKVPATILSRCQRFDFHRISIEDIASRLAVVCKAEGVECEEGSLPLIARRAEGGMRNALTTLEQLIAFGGGRVTLQGAENLLGSLDSADMAHIMSAIGRRDAVACFKWTASFVESGADLAQFARDMADHVRNIYVMSMAGSGVYIEVSDSERHQLESELQLFGSDRASRMLCVLGDLISELRTAGNPRLCFEIALTRLIRPDSDLTLESLAERIEALEEGKSAVATYISNEPSAASAVFTSVDPIPASTPMQSAPVQMPTMQVASTQSVPMQTPTAQVAPAQAASMQVTPTQTPTMQTPSAQVASAAFSYEPQMPQGNAQAIPAPSVSGPVTNDALRSAESGVAQISDNSQGSSDTSPGDLAAIVSNPAALQRVWRSVVSAVKKEKVSYGVLFVNVKAKPEPDGSGVVVEFPADNPFAFAMAGKLEVQDVISRAFSQVAGMSIPFRCIQAQSSSQERPQMSASMAPQPAPIPQQPVPVAQTPEPASSRLSDQKDFVSQKDIASSREQSPFTASSIPDANGTEGIPPWEDASSCKASSVPPWEEGSASASIDDDRVPLDAYDDMGGYDDFAYDGSYSDPGLDPVSAVPASQATVKSVEASSDPIAVDDLSKMLSGTMGADIIFKEVD